MEITKQATYTITHGSTTHTLSAPDNLTVEEIRAYIRNVDHALADQLADANWDAAIVAGKTAVTEYGTLPDWARTGTAAQAETYITGQVWNGQTQGEVETWIDANLANITTANIAQINARLASIRQALKLAAGAILAMRGLFILTAKLLIYVRDLVIRFRQ